ncbi:MAG: flagellin [Selenomonadaceae bacterium]|nr:flagellin [Selenomonadaceae bacterium]
MAYCATCPSTNNPDPQWFNFYFTDNNLPPPISVEKPEIDTDEDIKDIPIDISKVKNGDYAGLIKAIYDQAEPILKTINHQMFISGDTRNGVLTLYESYPDNNYENYSDVRKAKDGTLYGAIIMDGYKDTSIPVTEDYYEDMLVHRISENVDKEKRLVIQHTDKADQHITVHIPSTDLDSIFKNYYAYNGRNKQDILQYNLVSKEDRKALLGDGTNGSGAIDSALNYLLSAAVYVGAQAASLEYTENNVVTQIENTTASESTIRDADMAKEMTEYTKFNVIQQSAQAMLAQANQNSSGVLSLLQ